MTLVLDTDLVPAAERRDAVVSAYDGLSPRRTVTVDQRDVRHRVERTELGVGVHLLRTTGSALTVTRTARQVRADAPEHVALGLRRRGVGTVSVGGGDAPLPTGHLNLVDMTQPYRLRHSTSHEHDVLVVGTDQLGVSVDVVRAALGSLRRSPVYDLVRGHVGGLWAAVSELAPGHRAVTGQATTALVRALVTTATGEPVAAVDDSLAARVALYVGVHLAERDLTVERVAAAHAVSVRHLYNSWARAGHVRTPAEWIVQQRLERARHLLASAGSHELAIAVVARRCGFADSSHFSRRFRQATGCSPREWRAARCAAGT